MSQYQSLQDIMDAGKSNAHGYIIDSDMGEFGLIKVKVSFANILKRPKSRQLIMPNTPLIVKNSWSRVNELKRAKDIYLRKDDAVAEMKRLGLYKENRKESSHATNKANQMARQSANQS